MSRVSRQSDNARKPYLLLSLPLLLDDDDRLFDLFLVAGRLLSGDKFLVTTHLACSFGTRVRCEELASGCASVPYSTGSSNVGILLPVA